MYSHNSEFSALSILDQSQCLLGSNLIVKYSQIHKFSVLFKSIK